MILIMLHIRVPQLLHLIIESLYSDQHLPISPVPSPWQLQFYPTLCFYASDFFRFLMWVTAYSICLSLSGLFNSASWIYRFTCTAKFESFESFSFLVLPPLFFHEILITWILVFSFNNPTDTLRFVHSSSLFSLCCSDCIIFQLIDSFLCLLLHTGNPTTVLSILVIVFSGPKFSTCSSLYLLFPCWNVSISFLRLPGLSFISRLLIIAHWSIFVMDALLFAR